jgi:hypothetical protein
VTAWWYWALWVVAAVCLGVGIYGRIIDDRRKHEREAWRRWTKGMW